jgi:hypothetical protein
LFEHTEKRWLMLGGIAVTIGVLMLFAHIGRRALERATGHKTSGPTAPPRDQQSSP